MYKVLHYIDALGFRTLAYNVFFRFTRTERVLFYRGGWVPTYYLSHNTYLRRE